MSMKQSLWQEIITENPVFFQHILSVLKIRRFTNPILITFIISFIIYLLLAFSLAYNEFPVQILLYGQLVLLTLTSPLLTYSIISFEHEKATWDSLILTRLSVVQIILGKYISRVVIILATIILFSIPMLACVLMADLNASVLQVVMVSLINSTIVCLTWSLLLSAYSMWLSGKIRHGIASIGASIGSILIFVLFVPIFISSFANDDYAGSASQYLRHPETLPVAFNPFVIVANSAIGDFDILRNAPPINLFTATHGLFQSVVYVLFTAMFIILTISRVQQNDRKNIR